MGTLESYNADTDSVENREQICVLQLTHTHAETTCSEAAIKTLRQYLWY